MSNEENHLSAADDTHQQELKAEIAVLEKKLSALQDSAEAIQNKMNSFLLKQIEILSVFIAVVALVITNIIGIDALGNIGIKGLIRVDLLYVISIFVLLAGVKLFILGFGKHK